MHLLAVEIGHEVVLRLAGGHPRAVADLRVVPLGDLVQRLRPPRHKIVRRLQNRLIQYITDTTTSRQMLPKFGSVSCARCGMYHCTVSGTGILEAHGWPGAVPAMAPQRA